MNKKVIIIGNSHPSSIENMFYNSFKRNNIKVNFFDPNKSLSKIINNKLIIKFFRFIYFHYYNCAIYKYLCFNQKNNIIFFFKGESLNFQFLKNIKKKFNNNIYINYNTDNLFFDDLNINKKIRACIECFDYYFTWSKDIKNIIIKKKIKDPNSVVYLPFAYDQRYRDSLLFNKSTLIKKVLFYGSWDKEREKILSKIKSDKIEIYGNAWHKSSLQFQKNYKIFFRDIYGSELVKKIRKYSACLNINRKQVNNAHNMRLFEVTGYGGLIITPETPETKFFFKNNKSVIMYNSLITLKKILKEDFTKKHFLKMRNKSFKISKDHSYDKRILKILRTISNV